MTQAASNHGAGLQDVALGRHHALEAACERLVGAVLTEDPHAFATHWSDIDHELREHMAVEEELVLPVFEQVEPVEAAELRAEHAHIRKLLADIESHVANHGIHAGRLRRLVATLHAHAAREDGTLYIWADRNLPELTWQRVCARIGR